VHKKHLRIVLERLQAHGVTINASKSIFGRSKIKFLGHIVSSKGIQPTSEKVDALSSHPLPKTIGQLRKFVGLLNFYHRFVPHLAEMVAPLNELYKTSAKKNDPTLINWTDGWLG